jgi:nickel/cobalt exporter
LLLLVIAASAIAALPVSAHPLGNDNVEHVSVLWILPDRLEVDLFLYIAETHAAVVERDQMDTDQDGEITSQEQQAWLEKESKRLESEVSAELDGQPLDLKRLPPQRDPDTGKVVAPTRMIIQMPGFAQLNTYRIMIRFVATYPTSISTDWHVLKYEDNSYLNNPGLKRIILERFDDMKVKEPHPEFWSAETEPFRFEQYDPGNLPDERSATIHFRYTSLPEPAGASQPSTSASDSDSPSEAVPTTASTSPQSDSSVSSTSQTPESASARQDAAGADSDRPRRLLDDTQATGTTNPFHRKANQMMALADSDWGLMVLISMTALAFAWGAAHALMPGHAKTLVAAYLISQRGTYRHAVILAIVVTITHTALVVLVGGIWAYFQAQHPSMGPKLQLWLGIVSGLLVAGMGMLLIWRAVTGRLGHHHHHEDHHHHDEHRKWYQKLFSHSHPTPAGAGHHDHGHAHHHEHAHDHHHHHHHAHHHHDDHPHASAAGAPITTRTILLLGITGGMVPCPTATFIMLIGIGMDRVMLALYAIVIFSLGLALTLMAIGSLALTSRKFAARLMADEQHGEPSSNTGHQLLTRIVPAFSGSVVVLLGSLITANYVHMLVVGSALFSWLQ